MVKRITHLDQSCTFDHVITFFKTLKNDTSRPNEKKVKSINFAQNMRQILNGLN